MELLISFNYNDIFIFMALQLSHMLIIRWMQ